MSKLQHSESVSRGEEGWKPRSRRPERRQSPNRGAKWNHERQVPRGEDGQ